jgi:hypothetical protein
MYAHRGMNRLEFEALRDLPDKVIRDSIRLTQKHATRPLQTAERISIENSSGYSLVMNVNFNPETGSKGINVSLSGEGAICRLDVDGTNHGFAGRSHKHSVQDEQSVRRSLRDGVVPRSDLSGKPLRDVFRDFCERAKITFEGELEYDEASDE